MNVESKNLYLYILKCLTATLIVFMIAKLINYQDFAWCMISATLVITPDSNEAIPLAMTRIKANLIGGAGSVLCILMHLPVPVTITLAILITILACNFLNLMTGSRAAIAAVIIIILHGEEYDHPNFWVITFERLGSVIAGCIIALIVTVVFHRKIKSIKN